MKKMAEQIRYGAGGVPYVGPGGTPAPAPEHQEEPAVEPAVSVDVHEDDTPLSAEDVAKKAKGNGK